MATTTSVVTPRRQSHMPVNQQSPHKRRKQPPPAERLFLRSGLLLSRTGAVRK